MHGVLPKDAASLVRCETVDAIGRVVRVRVGGEWRGDAAVGVRERRALFEAESDDAPPEKESDK